MCKTSKEGEKKIQSRCKNCVGTGFVKYEQKICELCKCIKCMNCNQMDPEKIPWDLCEKCYGDGFFIIKDLKGDEKKTQSRCKNCVGTGFVKYEQKICELCKCIKCMNCNQMDPEKIPWDLCEKCYGDGYFMVEEVKETTEKIE